MNSISNPRRRLATKTSLRTVSLLTAVACSAVVGSAYADEPASCVAARKLYQQGKKGQGDAQSRVCQRDRQRQAQMAQQRQVQAAQQQRAAAERQRQQQRAASSTATAPRPGQPASGTVNPSAEPQRPPSLQTDQDPFDRITNAPQEYRGYVAPASMNPRIVAMFDTDTARATGKNFSLNFGGVQLAAPMNLPLCQEVGLAGSPRACYRPINATMERKVSESPILKLLGQVAKDTRVAPSLANEQTFTVSLESAHKPPWAGMSTSSVQVIEGHIAALTFEFLSTANEMAIEKAISGKLGVQPTAGGVISCRNRLGIDAATYKIRRWANGVARASYTPLETAALTQCDPAMGSGYGTLVIMTETYAKLYEQQVAKAEASAPQL